MLYLSFERIVNPFSGNSLVNHYFNKSGMSQLIDNELGEIVKYIGYQYSGIFRNLTNVFLSGGYDFDYDNQINANNKWDAKKTYKKNKGYFPGVATVGNKIVGIENRDGNANVKFTQEDRRILAKIYRNLSQKK